MPLFEKFNGIEIHVYYNEHLPAHIHAKYGEYEVLIDIRKLTIYVGKFPSKPLKNVIVFIKENQEELLEMFYKFNPELRP